MARRHMVALLALLLPFTGLHSPVAGELAASARQSVAPAPAQWAVVVGGTETRPGLVEAAQRATADALRAQFGYAPDRLIQLYGPAATQKGIREAFETVAKNVRPSDSLVLYILLPSIERKGVQYLIPIDGRDTEVWTLLGQDEFSEVIGRSRPRAALIVTSNCTEGYRSSAPSVQQAPIRRFASAGVSTLEFCDRGSRDFGAARFADAFGATLRNLDLPRLSDVDLAVRLRRSLPEMSISLKRDSPDVVDGFAFVVVRRRTETLVSQMRNARDVNAQVTAIEPLVTLARSTSDTATRAEVIKELGGAARNDDWAPAARLRALGALGEIGLVPAVPELVGVASMATAPPEVRRGAIDALARIGTAETLTPISKALDDTSAIVRVAAVRAAGGHRHLDSAAPVLARVADTDADVRVAALQIISLLSNVRPGARNLVTPIAAAARKAVTGALTDAYPAVRREAVNTLAKLGVDLARHPNVIGLLQNDGDDSVRAAVALTIGREYRGRPGEGARAPAFRHLLAAALSSPVQVRTAAIWSLGEIRDAQATGVLRTALRDDDMRTREAAIEALGKMRDAESVPNIIALLSDDEARVRIAAAHALGTISDSRAIEHLIRRRHTETVFYARQAIDQALAKLPPPALQVIVDALNADSPKVRLGAVERLAEITAPGAATYGIAALGDDDPEIRQAALAVILKRMPAWFGDVKAALDSEESATRFNAAAALGQVGTDEAGKALLARLGREQTPFVRAQIVAALGSVGPTADIETALLGAALEPDSSLRAAAATALSKYSTPRVQDTLRALADNDDEPLVREAAIRSLRSLFK